MARNWIIWRHPKIPERNPGIIFCIWKKETAVGSKPVFKNDLLDKLIEDVTMIFII
jgi:hypothetical protein